MSVRTPRGAARELILDAAQGRFAADGALAATLEEIREDAGVSTGALYHHFADKRALAGALYVRVLGRFQAEFAETLEDHDDAEDGIRGGVKRTIQWCLANRAEARLLFEGAGAADRDRLAELNRAFFRRIMRWYAGHAHYGVLRELDPALVSALWLGPAFEYLRAAPARVDTTTREELAESAWRALREERR
jgi:AcrR family transcriptional regulator